VTEVRGRGLLVGLDLDAEVAAEVAQAAQRHGVILNACTPSRIRLAPPLVLTADQAADFLELWPRILDDGYAAAARAGQQPERAAAR
jgi:acetylornithine aminotransferase